MKTSNPEVDEDEKLTLQVEHLTKRIQPLARVPRKCLAQLHRGLNQHEFKDIFPQHIYDRVELPTPNKIFTPVNLEKERLSARRLVELYATGVFGTNKNSHTCCIFEGPINSLKTHVTTNHTYVYTSSCIEGKQLRIMPHDTPVVDYAAAADRTKYQLVHLLFPWICDKRQYERILELNRLLGNKSKSRSLIYAINRLRKYKRDGLTIDQRGRRLEIKDLIDKAQNLLDDYDAWKKYQLDFIKNHGFPDQPLTIDKRIHIPYNHAAYLQKSVKDLRSDINRTRTLLHNELPHGKIKKMRISSDGNVPTIPAETVGTHAYLREILHIKLWYHAALHNKYASRWYQQKWKKTIDDFYNFDDLDQYRKYSDPNKKKIDPYERWMHEVYRL